MEGAVVYPGRPFTPNANNDPHGKIKAECLSPVNVVTVTRSWRDETTREPDDTERNDPDRHTTAETIELGIITVEDDPLSIHGLVTDWMAADDNDLFAGTSGVTGVCDLTMDNVGDSVWRSGRTSGTSEGTVGSEGSSVIGDIVDGYAVNRDHDGTLVVAHGLTANMLSIPGDSGGSAMMGDQPFGVVTGTNYRGEGNEGDWTWVAELDEALNYMLVGYEVQTDGSDEEPTEEPTEDPMEEPTDKPTEGPTESQEPTPAAETADEDGTATSQVWGETTAAPSAYIGDCSVAATTADETLEGSFSAVDGSGDGDGDGGQVDGGNGDDLPPTGSSTAPLVAGAAGLVALGALVYVPRRRQA